VPTLIVQFRGQTLAGPLAQRIVIGRWPTCDLPLEDAAISRLHAWVAPSQDGYRIFDARSREGVKVNGQLIRGSRPLRDGDQITIGPALLTYWQSDQVPEGVAAAQFKAAPPGARVEDGILFDCVCGAPLWVQSQRAGATGRCQFCRQPIVVPQVSGQVAQRHLPTGSTAATEPLCCICQWSIEAAQATHRCPSCGLLFHDECWTQNQGCSAYGCDQVGTLGGGGRIQQVDDPAEPEPLIAASEDRRHWLWISMGAAVAGIGAFGILSLVVMVLVGMNLARHRQTSRCLAVSMLVSLAGVLGGLVASYLWWVAGVRLGVRLGGWQL
jgi:hypothetical protein